MPIWQVHVSYLIRYMLCLTTRHNGLVALCWRVRAFPLPDVLRTKKNPNYSGDCSGDYWWKWQLKRRRGLGYGGKIIILLTYLWRFYFQPDNTRRESHLVLNIMSGKWHDYYSLDHKQSLSMKTTCFNCILNQIQTTT